MSKYHPLLCTGPVVRAILEGRQTQDRRPIKPQPHRLTHSLVSTYHKNLFIECWHGEGFTYYAGNNVITPVQPGDIFWVRETWAHDAPSLEACRQKFEDAMHGGLSYGPYFRADPVHEDTGLRWRPSIHMPKWACRLWLRVTDVRAERVQDISEEECLAEGLLVHSTREGDYYHWDKGVHPDHWFNWPDAAFEKLWDSLYAKRGLGWDTNPWVWVYEFERCDKPEDWELTTDTNIKEGKSWKE